MDKLDELRIEIANALGYELKHGFMDEASINPKDYWVTPQGGLTSVLPDWPRDIAAAWALVEQMCQSGDGLPCLIYKSGVDPDNWGKTYWVFELRLFVKGAYKFNRDTLIGYGDTAPEAICRAWLAWKKAQS